MTTWILLRGLTREKRHWGGFPGQLRAAFPDSGILELELPGNGELNALASPATIPGIASFCRASLARIGAAPPHVLVGMSMGAMVAAAWAERYPGEIRACVLISSSLGRFSPIHHRLRPGAWPALLGILLAGTAEGREQRIFSLTCASPHGDPGVLAQWAAIRRTRPVSGLNAFRQLLAAARYRAPLEAPVATLVLAGAGDLLVDPRCSGAIAKRWHCPLVVHPAAGHDLPLDDAAWVAGEIRKWWAALPPMAAG